MIKKEYIPNILTILRIVLIPIFIFYMLSLNYLIALICFSMASITDWADGYFARKFDVVSSFGTFLDPLADKLLVLSAFYSFLQVDILVKSGTIHIWMVGIILFRDISITVLRVIMNSKGNIVLVTSKIAKLKTFSQIITIIWILSSLTFSEIWVEESESTLKQLLNISYSLVITTTFLTLYTGVHYYYSNGRKLIHVLSNR